MKTLLIGGDITPAAELLREGGLVAVPTETVYGLAGNGLDASVIERIYEVKGRPAVKPISLMVANSDAIADLCETVPQAAIDAGAEGKSQYPGDPPGGRRNRRPTVPAAAADSAASAGTLVPFGGAIRKSVRTAEPENSRRSAAVF